MKKTIPFLLLLCAPVFATDKGRDFVDVNVNNNSENRTFNENRAVSDVVNQNNVGNGDTIMDSGDVNLNSRAYAVANNMGDVDINDCRESSQFGTPLFSRQWVKLNPWCAAESYDAKGLHDVAARIRCEIKEISRLFDDRQSCIAANTMRPSLEPTVAMLRIEQHEDRDDEQERRLAEQSQVIEQLQQQIQAIKDKPAKPARTIQKTVIEPKLTDKQLAALRELKK